jgi:hypothetical protein
LGLAPGRKAATSASVKATAATAATGALCRAAATAAAEPAEAFAEFRAVTCSTSAAFDKRLAAVGVRGCSALR